MRHVTKIRVCVCVYVGIGVVFVYANWTRLKLDKC